MIYRIIPVHGTFAGAYSIRGHQWWQKGSSFSQEVLSYLDDEGDDRIRWEPFPWSGANSITERDQAARDLSREMRRKVPLPHKSIYLCHSHGGNVFSVARNHLGPSTDQPIGITVGTPYLVEQSFATLGIMSMFSFLATLALYVGPVLLLLLTFFDFRPLIEMVLIWAVIASAGLYLLVPYMRWSASFMGTMFSEKPPLFMRMLLIIMRKRFGPDWPNSVGDQNREMVDRNYLDIKVFSILDEAIAGLKRAHEQRVEIADAQNIRGPATVFWTLLVMLSVLTTLVVFKVEMSFDSDLSRYKILSHSWTDPNLDTAINLVGVICAFLILSFNTGRVLAATPAAAFFANRFNDALSNLLLRKATGKDARHAVSIPHLTDTNLPVFGRTRTRAQRWQPMPRDFDLTLEDKLQEGTAETARAIRQTLAMGMLSDDFNLFSAVAKNFSGEELVHTSYFRHPDFAKFTAWLLVTYHGFPPSAAFTQIDAEVTEKFKTWLEAIRPTELDQIIAAPTV